MIIVPGKQGTPEWHDLRLGIPTASCFDRIVTPTGKPSAQADQYLNELIAEWVVGKPYGDWDGNIHTERGHLFEDDARAVYEWETNSLIEQVAFIYRDESRMVGCSPDGLRKTGDVYTRGIEIKCPIDTIHVAYLAGGTCPKKYIPQIQGGMWNCGLDQWDFESYHQDWDPFIVTIERDDVFSKMLDKEIPAFIDRLLTKRADPRIAALRENRFGESND